MSDTAWSKEDQRALASAAEAVSEHLDAWDPIGVYANTEGPTGEYDDLAWPLVRLLVDGAPDVVSHSTLSSLLAEQYGTAAPDAETIATRLRAWWDTGPLRR